MTSTPELTRCWRLARVFGNPLPARSPGIAQEKLKGSSESGFEAEVMTVDEVVAVDEVVGVVSNEAVDGVVGDAFEEAVDEVVGDVAEKAVD